MLIRRAALLLSLPLAAGVALPTALAARPMTPQDVARIESTAGIAISRDGSHIAYTTLSRPDVTKGEENGGARQELFLANAPMQARAWLPEGMEVSRIGFTPDGAMIAFLWSDKGEKRALWGVPVGGGPYRKLAAIDGADIKSYSFAPSGSEVYLIAAPAKDDEREAESDAGFNSRVYEEELRTARVFAANVGEEVDAAPRQLELPGEVYSFEVAPNGEFAVFTSAPTTLVDDQYTRQRASILNLFDQSVVTVETPGKLGDIEISPDSRKLSMIAAVDANDPAATTLYLVDAATGEFTALNEGAPEAAVDAEWMADGRLASVIHVGAQSLLRYYSDSGEVLGNVDPGDLILTGLDQGGNILIATANSPAHPSELFVASRSGFERWTEHNPWLAEIDFGTQRTLTYAARDGQVIEGILIEPVSQPPLGGSPLILDVHGGPESHESNGWVTSYSNPGQVAAGEGYAVFLPNYRGSTAYGTAFSKQHQGDAAGKEFDDLVDAKHALVEQLVADGSRVGVTGGSYGGFATAWSSTRYSEEFAAGVMFVGISDLLSKLGTTDIPTEEFLVHARAQPWDNYEFTIERSPITYAGQAETPLLIMHGEDDPRVSPTQSLELYRNIKIRKPETPVRLVWYPGEGHGNAMAASRYDYNLRMMEWFDTYLKTGNRSAALPAPRPDLMIEKDES
ncbi:S9 family peptidase [Aurantiacibacter xanthus]|uniref:S9 family peptidase n=1 Tax=Aurantiacibacter xanthus TaxID=1784712 RepID=A0A3A1PCM3_9SPHN|nr:S9 family peptidase [Aurantiacibacter xanthus]RIV90684.1 S9 family peptidase [Aurantiacibacter xanthus]